MIYDYHTHTMFSEDSEAPVDDMIRRAVEIGVAELAITDHYDPDYPDPNYEFVPDFPEYHAMLDSKQKEYADRIKIVKGIEIGIQDGDTIEKCRAQAAAFDYDYIIGSFHCFCGYDLYTADYDSMNEKEVIPDFYKYMHSCLSQFKDYDVVGHFNVIDRYVPFELDYSNCMDICEAVLKMIVEDGKGIEINTSSFRYGMGDRTHAAGEFLQTYHDMGGEIVTIGSDAHKPEDLGHEYERAADILRSHGFRYLATFSERRPTMIKL